LKDEENTQKKCRFSKLNRKLTLLFVVVAIVAPAFGIFYFYTISVSVIPEDLFAEQSELLKVTAVFIISIIAVDAGIIGFIVSRSISKPINELHCATQEVEKGNFNVRTDIKTNDEIEELSNAFNTTTAALSKMDEERRQIDHAKTEFLSITSHELRSPMTPMKAQLQMLENEYFGKMSKEQKDSLSIIIRNADRLDKIILDFLEISRIEAARLKFNFKETDLTEAVNETVEFMKGFARERKIDLIINADELPTIEADPDRISQILRNLINNAIKFSDEGGKIEIIASSKQDHILFGVKDYGVGLTPENRSRVFEPFYQVEKSSNRKHGGTGLGLAICRGIVESQKGKIWIESTLGEGSTFYFTIPMQPVRDIEPIKVLFSHKGAIEKKIKEEFKTILGPLGEGEFNELKSKNALWKEDIFGYIEGLTDQYILNSEQSTEFKNKIGEIFGEDKKVSEIGENNNENKTFKDEVMK